MARTRHSHSHNHTPSKISRVARGHLPGFWLQLRPGTSPAFWPGALRKAVTRGTPCPPRARAQPEAVGRRKRDHPCLSRGGIPAEPPAKIPPRRNLRDAACERRTGGPSTRAAARARYVPEHRCSQKDPRPEPTSGQSSAGVSCARDRSHGRRRLGG